MTEWIKWATPRIYRPQFGWWLIIFGRPLIAIDKYPEGRTFRFWLRTRVHLY